MNRPTLCLVAAVARNGVIGNAGGLPWHLPEDLKHFKRVTLGHPVLMGRKTWDALPARFRPLPGRRNIVVTRNAEWRSEGARAAPSIDAALAALGDAPKVCVIGGARLFAQALPMAEELELTEIERDFEGETRFPDWDMSSFVETRREHHHAGPPNDFDYAFVSYRRKPSSRP